MKTLDNSIRVLIADDHSVVRTGIRQFLETSGDLSVIAEARDGQEAISMIQKDPPDVAVLDIQMPNKTGLEVTKWIRANGYTFGILILTAYDDEPYATGVLQAGANGYVLKTANPLEIIQAVRDVNAGRSVVDAIIAQKIINRVTQKPTLPIQTLTSREAEVLNMVARGFTNKSIALKMSISDRTVQGHLAHIFDKLQAESRTEAVMKAVGLGWIDKAIGEWDENQK